MRVEYDSPEYNNENIKKALENGYLDIKNYIHGKELLKELLMYKTYDKVVDITLPKLFINGDNDLYTSHETAIKCSSESPNSEVYIIKDGIHSFKNNYLHQMASANRIISFIKKNQDN